MYLTTIKAVKCIPRNGAKVNKITPWSIAVTDPPRALPRTIPDRLMGATKISP